MTSLHDILPKLRKHSGDLNVSDYFVDWPGKEKGHVLHSVEATLSVDEALHALFGRDAPIGEVTRHKQGTLEYFETEWLAQESVAAQAFVELAAIRLANSSLGEAQPHGGGGAANGYTGAMNGGRGSEIAAGHCRMNMSQSRHMAMKSYTVERERCLAAAPGREYLIEVSVCSTALGAHHFRSLFRHRLAAVGEGRTRWSVSYILQFVEKTNFFLRKTLETGASQAIKSNFGVLEAALKEYASGRHR